MANGCRTFCKVILGILTALFLIIGLFMLGFGIALKVDPDGLFKMVSKMSQDAGNEMIYILGDITSGFGVFMIVLGCITTVISFIGFAGAVSGSTCLLVVYAVIMFLFLGAEIALIIVVAAFPEKVAGKIAPITNFTKEDAHFYNDTNVGPPNDTLGLSWYLVQNYFNCCGLVSSDDYKSPNIKSRIANADPSAVTYYNKSISFPISCCEKKHHSAYFNKTSDLTDIQSCKIGTGSFNKDGCAKQLVATTGTIPIAIAVITLAIEVLLIIFAVVIVCLKDDSKL